VDESARKVSRSWVSFKATWLTPICPLISLLADCKAEKEASEGFSVTVKVLVAYPLAARVKLSKKHRVRCRLILRY